LQLVLATGEFAICFAVFGSVSAMMPILKKNLALDPVQVTGEFTLGFALLALFAVVCFIVVFKSGSNPDPKTQLVSHGASA